MKQMMKNLHRRYLSTTTTHSQQETSDPEELKKQLRKLQKDHEQLKTQFAESVVSIFKERRSIRKFDQKPVSWETQCAIIEGAMNAPCAGNVQNYEIIVVRDKKRIHELGRIASQQFWLCDAPIVFVVTRDNTRLMDLYPVNGERYAIQNVAAVIENILMLAQAYGLGACWVEEGDNDVLKEQLGVPPGKNIDAVIPIGYPLEAPEVPKVRMMTKVFFDRHGNRRRK